MSRNNKNSSSPTQMSTRIKNLLEGFAKVSPSEQFDVLGTVSAPTALQTELQGHLAPITAADDAELAAKQARETRDAGSANTVARVEAIEEAVRSHYGKKSPKLVGFGLTPLKDRAKPSPQQHATTVAKANATRDARRAAKKLTGTPPPLPPTTPTK